MRAVITLLVVIVLVAIVGVLTGFINLSGRPGELPKIAVEGGALPKVDAEVGSIDVGTKNTTIEVPKVETKKERIEVPSIEVKKPN